jgi:ABC-type antimicrobial peptide transport system permease subunit
MISCLHPSDSLVNFINLLLLQAVNQLKEVGIRKVLGSNKIDLKIQFITETFLIVLMSVLLAIIIAILGALHRQSFGKTHFISCGRLSCYGFISALNYIVVTALAGFYPSIVLSRDSIRSQH